MADLLDILFEDGNWRVIDIEHKASSDRAAFAASEWDIAFSDLTDGLYIYFSRMTPTPRGTSVEDYSEGKGFKSFFENDFYIQALGPDEVSKVSLIKYRGSSIYERVLGELIPLHKLIMLGNQYLDGDKDESVLVAIAQLSYLLEDQLKMALSDPDAPDKGDSLDDVAAKLGIPREIILKARELTDVDDEEISIEEVTDYPDQDLDDAGFSDLDEEPFA